MVVVDNKDNITDLHQAAVSAAIKLNVLLDLDSGTRRTGARVSEALEYAKFISTKSALVLRGVQCYAGHLQHITEFEERRKLSLEAMNAGRQVVEKLIKEGFLSAKDYIFTGSGTGTHDIDIEVAGLTDMQVGSYVMMDTEYLHVGSKTKPEEFSSTFAKPPLTLLSSVVSATHYPERVTIDAGLKAIYKDGLVPEVVYPATWTKASYTWAGDEHGFLDFDSGIEGKGKEKVVGRVVELYVSHCDPTINLFELFYVSNKGTIVDVWPIDARGKNQ